MTLPSSGPIDLGQVNVELGKSATTVISLNNTDVRALAGVPATNTTISMDNLRGKSAAPPIPGAGAAISARLTNTSATISIPANEAGKDYLLIAIGSSAAVVAAPVGFTQLYYVGTGSNYPQFGIYGKIADGSTSTTASTGSFGSAGAYYSAVIKNTTTSPNISVSSGQSISSNVPASEAFPARCFGISVAHVGAAAPSITAYPTPLTDQRALANAPNSSSAAIAGASAALNASAATGTFTYNQVNYWRTARVSFRTP
jgi:hypothetical protein